MPTASPISPNLSDKFVDDGPVRAACGRIVQFLQEAGTQPGDALPSEAELAARLSMGRQQVREGLSVLKALGAVTASQGARHRWCGYNPAAAVVTASMLLQVEAESLRGLLEVRHALEAALLPTVAVRIDTGTLEELRALADRMIERADAGLSFSDLDEDFHRRLFAPLGNPVLDAILVAFWTQFDVITNGRASIATERGVAHMHARIVDALIAGDQRLAVHELDAHFFGVRQFLDAAAEENPGTADLANLEKDTT